MSNRHSLRRRVFMPRNVLKGICREYPGRYKEYSAQLQEYRQLLDTYEQIEEEINTQNKKGKLYHYLHKRKLSVLEKEYKRYDGLLNAYQEDQLGDVLVSEHRKWLRLWGDNRSLTKYDKMRYGARDDWHIEILSLIWDILEKLSESGMERGLPESLTIAWKRLFEAINCTYRHEPGEIVPTVGQIQKLLAKFSEEIIYLQNTTEKSWKKRSAQESFYNVLFSMPEKLSIIRVKLELLYEEDEVVSLADYNYSVMSNLKEVLHELSDVLLACWVQERKKTFKKQPWWRKWFR